MTGMIGLPGMLVMCEMSGIAGLLRMPGMTVMI